MRILLKGYYGFGNLGDDILMLVSFNLLKQLHPKARITVFSNNARSQHEVSSRLLYNNYISEILGQDVEIIDWTHKGFFDLIFQGGGGIYFDKTPSKQMFVFINNVIKVLGVNVIQRIDSFFRKVLVKPNRLQFNERIGLGIGVGPFDKSSKQLYRKMAELGSYNLIITRDQLSYTMLKSLKFNGPHHRGTDLSFATYLWMNPGMAVNRVGRKVGIVLKGSDKELTDYYIDLAENLQELDFEIEFFAFDEYFDQFYINRTNKEFKVNVWRPNENNLDDYIKHFWECSICITDRAHGAIIGIIGGVLPLVIDTDQKSDQISTLLGLEDLYDGFVIKKYYKVQDVLRITNNQGDLCDKLRKLKEDQKRIISVDIDLLKKI